MADLVFNYLTTEFEIDFNKCRGQSYNNAANMAGRYNGMQQNIIEKNKFARCMPCAAHSLNLVGRSAVDCCLDAVNFLGIINQIYTFFSSSTKRWAILKIIFQHTFSWWYCRNPPPYSTAVWLLRFHKGGTVTLERVIHCNSNNCKENHRI